MGTSRVTFVHTIREKVFFSNLKNSSIRSKKVETLDWKKGDRLINPFPVIIRRILIFWPDRRFSVLWSWNGFLASPRSRCHLSPPEKLFIRLIFSSRPRTLTHALTCTHLHTLSNTCTHFQTHSLTLSHTHTHTNTFTLTHAPTGTRTHRYTHPRTHAH